MKKEFFVMDNERTNNESQTTASFEETMNARMNAYFGGQNQKAPSVADDRLREMSKKLPAWSLEPPYSFLK